MFEEERNKKDADTAKKAADKEARQKQLEDEAARKREAAQQARTAKLHSSGWTRGLELGVPSWSKRGGGSEPDITQTDLFVGVRAVLDPEEAMGQRWLCSSCHSRFSVCRCSTSCMLPHSRVHDMISRATFQDTMVSGHFSLPD